MVGMGVRSGMEGREPEGWGELGFMSVTGKTKILYRRDRNVEWLKQ